MHTVVIVEPNLFLCLGIEHYIKSLFPNINVKNSTLVAKQSDSNSLYFCDLLLLSVNKERCIYTAIDETAQRFQCSKVLLLSDEEKMPSMWSGLPSFVVGYVGYSTSPQLLAESIERALGCIAEPIALETDAIRPVKRYVTNTSGKKIDIPVILVRKEARLLGVTGRQYEVLVYLAHGLSNAEIGVLLNISISTVRKHIQEIFSLLHARNRNQAVFNAFESGASLGLRT